MKLLMREWPPFGEEKSRWPPSMSPAPGGVPGLLPWSDRLGRRRSRCARGALRSESALVAGRRPELEAEEERIGRQQRNVGLHRAADLEEIDRLGEQAGHFRVTVEWIEFGLLVRAHAADVERHFEIEPPLLPLQRKESSGW